MSAATGFARDDHAGSAVLTPGRARAADPEETRLLVVGPGAEGPVLRRMADLPACLAPDDLLVLNDAATLPASLVGRAADDAAVEARLAGIPLEGEAGRWRAVLFGAGDWRIPTEQRPLPPVVRVGERLRFGARTSSAMIEATVVSVEPPRGRLVELAFAEVGADFWQRLYRVGRPVQYAHVPRALAPWDVQTPFASRPWAAEAPSASFALSFALLGRLRARGVRWVTVTHAAGLSSTGDPLLDARLPFPERFEVGPRAVEAIEAAGARGGRVVAVGTSVVRALESAADAGVLRPASGLTSLRLGPERPVRVVDALLTGLHEEGTSHAALLGAFVSRERWRTAYALAAAHGLRGHELGDVALVYRPARLNR